MRQCGNLATGAKRNNPAYGKMVEHTRYTFAAADCMEILKKKIVDVPPYLTVT